MADRVTIRWQLDPSSGRWGEKGRVRKFLTMRRIALTLAFLAIAAVLALVLAVLITAQN
jgi:hypothetical protein